MIQIEPNPIDKFQRWYKEAARVVAMPEAMTLATVAVGQAPSARMVLLRSCDERGFVFYTNYKSAKAQELQANPHAALVFYWHELGRQVRVAGSVTKVTREESLAYWHSRAEKSRVSACASKQSEILPERAALERRVAELAAAYRDKEIPLPDYWGGFRVDPAKIEFWQNGEHRLHDRLQYEKATDGAWIARKLYP